MPERGFSTERWNSDEWFQDLTRDQRSLWWYLYYNSHCNQAGLYHITLTTIAFEAKFTKAELPDLITSLEPKIKWWPEVNLIWVKDFIHEQSKSSKFVQAAAKSLTSINHDEAIQELLDYYEQNYSLSIPYGYYMDSVSVQYRYSRARTVPVTDTGTDTSEDKGVVKGEKKQPPGSEPETDSHQSIDVETTEMVSHSHPLTLNSESEVLLQAEGIEEAPQEGYPLKMDPVTAEFFNWYEYYFKELPDSEKKIEELKDLAGVFKGEFSNIEGSIWEAHRLEKKDPNYIGKILERWEREGGPDGLAAQHIKEVQQEGGTDDGAERGPGEGYGAHRANTRKGNRFAKKPIRIRE